jgi:NAD(P)-dependent dehydrogenase (short-subunit alcohol dehydrogenase family)
MRLKDKVVIVTGVAGGIGRAFANALVKEGAKLTISDIKPFDDLTKELEGAGGEVLSLKVDITKEADTKMMAAKTIEKYGRIDILINNAAIFGGLTLAPVLDVSVDLFRKVIDTNIAGTFLCSQAVLPQMVKQKSGNIINVGSTIWLLAKLPLIHYVTSKAAIMGFTRCLAGDPTLNTNNIRCNSLMPGGTWDEATLGILGDIPGVEEKLLADQNIHRREMPEDLVGPMLFLCSDDSAIMSGNSVAADAGLCPW